MVMEGAALAVRKESGDSLAEGRRKGSSSSGRWEHG